MEPQDSAYPEHARNTIRLLGDCFDVVFERAPVMMHSIRKDGRIIRANRRWFEILGYEESDVLGRKSVDFLTEESRAWALRDAIPLFWRAGSARSIGYRFLKKDGHTLDLLLDGETSAGAGGDRYGLAALRIPEDMAQWQEASAVLTTLQDLARQQRDLDLALSQTSDDALAVQPAYGEELDLSVVGEAVGSVLETAQDISTSLRGF